MASFLPMTHTWTLPEPGMTMGLPAEGRVIKGVAAVYWQTVPARISYTTEQVPQRTL